MGYKLINVSPLTFFKSVKAKITSILLKIFGLFNTSKIKAGVIIFLGVFIKYFNKYLKDLVS